VRRLVTATLLMQLLLTPSGVFAEASTIAQAALSEGALMAHRETAALRDQAAVPATNRSKGHPVLLGIAIGAGSGALLGAVSSSCSSPSTPEFPHPCGSRLWLEGAVIGAGVGAGVGALAGLVVWAVRR
jgi:hypothetical protein